MNTPTKAKTREFLYSDENVKYSFTHEADEITINCDHPIFIRRYNGSTATLKANDFFKSSLKGTEDYAFFEKLRTAIQEQLQDFG